MGHKINLNQVRQRKKWLLIQSYFLCIPFLSLQEAKIEILIYHLISIWPCYLEDLTKMFTVTLKMEEIIHSTMQNEFE